MPFLVRVMGLDAAHSEMDRIAKVDLRTTLKEAARLVAEDAKARTHSRRVRAAITSDVQVRSAREFRAAVGPLRRKAFFAHFLEWGTKASEGTTTRKVPGRPSVTVRYAHGATLPQPFLVPAAIANEQRVVDLVGRAFDLRKASGEGRGFFA